MPNVACVVFECFVQEFPACKKWILRIDDNADIPIFNIGLAIFIMGTILTPDFGCDFVNHSAHGLR